MPGVPGADNAPVPAAINADSPENSPSLPSCASCAPIFKPPDIKALDNIVLPPSPISPGAINGAAAARKGKAGLTSLGIILSNALEIGLVIFFKNPINLSLYYTLKSKFAKLVNRRVEHNLQDFLPVVNLEYVSASA